MYVYAILILIFIFDIAIFHQGSTFGYNNNSIIFNIDYSNPIRMRHARADMDFPNCKDAPRKCVHMHWEHSV